MFQSHDKILNRKKVIKFWKKKFFKKNLEFISWNFVNFFQKGIFFDSNFHKIFVFSNCHNVLSIWYFFMGSKYDVKDFLKFYFLKTKLQIFNLTKKIFFGFFQRIYCWKNFKNCCFFLKFSFVGDVCGA